MKKETSAGIVVFFKENSKFQYLLIQYNKKNEGYWGLPKGHIEKGETLIETAIRETKEETGLNVKPMDGFMKTIEYTFKQNNDLIKKTVYFYVGESDTKEVKISHEHLDFVWLSYSDAIKKLTYDKDRDVLIKANLFLTTIK
jgi:8-oxo-dGTP pyrophosphatase MutT (NUDIX family)